MDAVLPDGQLQQLQNDWLKRYSLQFESFLEPSEQLRSRIYREFKSQKPTVIEVRKVKSVLNLATPRAQEQVQLPGGVQLHFDRDNGLHLRSVLEYYQQLRVLMHAWAWSGNYYVSYNSDNILMMDLSSALSYADRCLKDVLEFGGGSLKWLERNDVLTRGKVATYIRRGWPASVALVEALRETHIEWRSPVWVWIPQNHAGGVGQVPRTTLQRHQLLQNELARLKLTLSRQSRWSKVELAYVSPGTTVVDAPRKVARTCISAT